MSDYAAFADTNEIYGIDSTYIYDADLNKDWFYLQKDVYCFKNVTETEHVGALGAIVDSVVYWDEMTMTQFNEVYFNASSTIYQRALKVEAIHNMSNYRISALALTSSPTADYTQNKYYRTDDHIMVTFKDPAISVATVNNFMTGRIIINNMIAAGSNQVKIDLSLNSNGLYLFNIYNNEGKQGVAKLVK